MIHKKKNLVIRNRRPVSDFFNRSQEVFERKFDGFPAMVEGPSRQIVLDGNVADIPPLDISGYLTNNATPPCPDSPGCAACAEAEPLFGTPDDWTVDSTYPDSMDLLTYSLDSIIFTHTTLSDTAIVYVPFNTGAFPWAWTVRVLIEGTDSGAGGGGGHITAGYATNVPPSGGSNNRVSIEVNPRGSAGAGGGDIPSGVHYLQVSTVIDQPLGNDKSEFAVPGSIGMSHPYDFFMKSEINGANDVGFKVWLAGDDEPEDYIVDTVLGQTGDRYFFFRFDGGNFDGTITINELNVPGVILSDRDCDCSGSTVTSTLIENTGEWAPHEDVGTVDYYATVWYDGLMAAKGIDYDVVDGAIVPKTTLDPGTIVRARYVIL
jgi:hypothetical protein